MSNDDPKWVCRDCIGRDVFTQFTIGLIGRGTCAVCGRRLTQPPLAFVSHDLYLEALRRRSELPSRESEGEMSEDLVGRIDDLHKRVTSNPGIGWTDIPDVLAACRDELTKQAELIDAMKKDAADYDSLHNMLRERVRELAAALRKRERLYRHSDSNAWYCPECGWGMGHSPTCELDRVLKGTDQ